MRAVNKRTNQKGDTIVEVMLAIAVVGMVLGASYSIANRALQTGRFAQEQTEALKVAESELELLKYKASQFKSGDSTTGTIFEEPSGSNPIRAFCIVDDATLTVQATTLTPDIATGQTLVQNSCGSNGLYTTFTTYKPSENLFVVYVYWESPLVSNAKVEVAYKLYK